MDDLVIERMKTAERGYIYEAQRLTFVRELTEAEWVRLGRELAKRLDGNTWALGDWLVAGGRTGVGVPWYGGSYEKAMAITGYSRGFLSSAYNVSVIFPPDVRKANTSWAVHRACLRLPHDLRSGMLSRAVADKMSRRKVDEVIDGMLLAREQQAKAPIAPKKAPEPPPVRAHIPPSHIRREEERRARVKCPSCSHVFPIKGHKVQVPVEAEDDSPRKWGGFRR